MNKGLIWTNGVFDLLHPGHIEMLKFAKMLGNRLVVGIDDDSRVAKLKGPSRPINDLTHRKSILQAIKYVDEVVEFGDDESLEELLNFYNPEIIVESPEWMNKLPPFIKTRKVVPFERIEPYSSSGIIFKIQSLQS